MPNVEHYEYVPSAPSMRNPWPRCPAPDALNYPRKEYGNRVGLGRLLALSERLGIRFTASMSLAVPEMFPEQFAAMRQCGWDFLCHGLYNTHYLWDAPEDEERVFVADCQCTRSGSLVNLPYSMHVNDVVLHLSGAAGGGCCRAWVTGSAK